jgi:cyclase
MDCSFGRAKVPTELNLFDWAKEVEQRGREILFTPWIMTERRTDLQMKRCQNFRVWSISYNRFGAGNIQHFVDSFTVGKADAALASVFHFKEIEIKALKTALKTIILKLEVRFEVLKSKFKSTLHFITCNLKL